MDEPTPSSRPETAAYVPGGDAHEPPLTDIGTPITLPGEVTVGSPSHIPGYEVLEELGRGGMGVVYKARQVGLGRIVALKVVLHAAVAGKEARARFRNEAKAIARLKHSNIVAIHEIGDAGGLPFFSMEYCPGGSLAHRLAQGPMQPHEAAALVRTLALAVQAAHDQQVIHRDLKPGNILLAADGTPKVADFGLARRTDEAGQTASGAILGTPSYMAPEQARGKVREMGPATDVYALGAILYECLTGRPPFRTASRVDTLMAVVSEPPVPPRQLRPEVPMGLEAICLKCLEKDPARRMRSGEELAHELAVYSHGQSGVPCRPRHRRWRLPVAAAGLLVVGLLFGVWSFLNSRVKENHERVFQRAEASVKASLDKGRLHLDAAVERKNERGKELKEAAVEKRVTKATPRYSPTSPGLVLNTGARTATCDQLTFTPDGSELLAAGDDKVVRIWKVGESRFIGHVSRTLRWPIYREQRGGIFAMALSPDASRLVIGGFGILTGYLAVLDRRTGDIVHALERPTTVEPIWSAAFSPDGRYVVYGTDRGKVFRWDLGADAKTSIPFANRGTPGINRVHLIAFFDDTHFISVAQDGIVREWDVTKLKEAPREMKAFGLPALLRVAMSKDGRWLAACGESTTPRRFEIVDLQSLRAGAPAHVSRRGISFPQEKGSTHYPRTLAFNTAGDRLAVGVQVVPDVAPPGGMNFAPITGGMVHVFDVASGNTLTPRPVDVGYRVECIAFRPGHKDQIATAGGNNHEVRLWDLTDPAKPLDEIRSPGSCLWGVAMSGDHYLAWQEKRSAFPKTPNDWGAGPWRILDLKKRTIVTGKPPVDFKPVKTINRYGEWRIQTTEGFLWHIMGPRGTNVPLDWSNHLYLTATNQLPRCYTFLPPTAKTPVPRLAVGHMWGVSVYELRPRDVRLARLLIGHEGEVMAAAPSQDGRLLVTASRDQTLIGWSLEDWPNQRELGASFSETPDGKIQVRDVAGGSPAWEAGLTPGDEIIMLVSTERDRPRGFVYDPENRGQLGGRIFEWKHKGLPMLALEMTQRCSNGQVLDKLGNVEAGREYIFVWKHGKELKFGLTTVRQRPLWRFFPTRSGIGNDWVIWRWRDFYYDTNSFQADRFVGWHVNAADLHTKPRFYALEDFRGVDDIRGPKGQRLGFHRPDKIWGPRGVVAGGFLDPEKVLFADIEPPEVKVKVVQKPGKNTDLVLAISIKPRSANPQQKLARVTLWLDDYRPGQQPAIGATTMIDGKKVDIVDDEKFVIPRGQLRQGINHVTVQCYNEQGGRGQATVDVEFND
jgi:serine/threonine protein kinase/WD40 repeat protein